MATTRREWLRYGLVAAGFAGLLVGAFVFGWIGPTRVAISASYAYDVSDPTQVFGDASFVIVGRVEEDLGRVQDDRTAFRVSVLDELKGDVPAVIEVTQDGFRRGRATWELDDFPLFEVGRTYVMALTIPAPHWNQQRLHVLIGPLDGNGPEVTGPNDPVVALYRSAVGDARYPEGFTAEFIAGHLEMARRWIEAHPGYSSPGPTDLP